MMYNQNLKPYHEDIHVSKLSSNVEYLQIFYRYKYLFYFELLNYVTNLALIYKMLKFGVIRSVYIGIFINIIIFIYQSDSL